MSQSNTNSKEEENTEIIRALEAYDYVRLCWVDLNGIHLSKLVSTKFAKKIINGDCEVYSGIISFGPRMEVVDVSQVVQRKHVNAHIRPDFDTLHPCPWAGQLHKSPKQPVDPRVGAVLCDIYWPEGDPMQAYPRFVVKRLLQELEDRYKLRLFSAFEPEFRAFKLESMDRSCANPVNAPKEKSSDPPGDPEPFTSGEDMYKTGLLAQYESFFMDVDMKVREVGIDVQDYSNENAAGQLECPLMPKVGLQAADHYFLFKQALKEIGIQHNIGVSFMTTPMIEGLSSGCHYNHSLWNIESEANAFFDPKNPNKLSVVALHWIGGLMTHLPAILALCSPSVNCYRRLHKKLAPDAVNWDINDRFVAVRVKNTDEKRTYIENRIPSSASCPYHVMAATVAAGMDGLERQIMPPSPGEKPINGKATKTCKLLPNSLQEAISELLADQTLVERLGAEFVNWYVQTKQRGDLKTLAKSDVTKNSSWDLAFERNEYLSYI
ncbi:Glutamine synthetase [Fasciolopsis buskii]|uniref:Lengsin n=1 Tax=Fasciolopsis buskii TaxID=27845 RepID=A0A8E0S3I2_9TREM|nr:Glutamine synthetase [Fasciolopsis buski]